jgi:hypothetical protein
MSKKPSSKMNDMELMERFDTGPFPQGDPAVLDSSEDQRSLMQAKLQGLQHLSEIVRGHLELESEHAASLCGDKMWAAIDSAIGKVASGSERQAIVIEDRSGVTGPQLTSTVRAKAAAEKYRDNSDAVATSRAGLWGWMATHRAHFVTAALSAGVVAGIALWVRTNGAVPPIRSEPSESLAVVRGASQVEMAAMRNANPSSPITMPSTSQPVLLPAVTPTDIESLDVPDGSGTVMTITDDDGDTAVIWISPKDVEGL